MLRVTVVLGAVLLLLAAPAGALAANGASADPSASHSPAATAPPDGAPPVTVAHGADDLWHNTEVTVTFTATSETSTVAATYVQIDTDAPVATTEVKIGAPKDHADDGVHTLTFWSVDAEGRTEAPQTVQVKIDTTPPEVTRLKLGPSLLHQTKPIKVSVAFSDISGAARAGMTTADQYGYLARRDKAVDLEAGARTLKLVPRYGNRKAFTPGVFRTTLTLTDQAGNETVCKPLVFRDYHPARASVTYTVHGAGKLLALTFDDGGSAATWSSMLNTLKRFKMHATFFVIGPYVRAERGVAKRVVREGHAIGSHGWTHSEMTRQGYDGVRRELVESEGPWWSIAKVSPVSWMRPPYGSHNGTTVAAAGSVGFTHVVMWDVDPGDWRGYGASTIAANTLSHVHSGAIVGLHVRPATAAALPTILAGLRARGYRSVSLPELFHAAGKR